MTATVADPAAPVVASTDGRALDVVPVGRELSPWRVVGLLLASVGAVIALSTILGRAGLDLPALPANVGAKLATAAVALAVVDGLGWWRRVGFRAPVRWGRLWLAWLPLLYLLLVFAPGFPASGVARTLAIASLALAVSLDEEVWTRGLLLESLRHRGTWPAVLLSSAFFGLFHGLNVISGQPASTTAVQVFVAFSFGLALGAVRVRTHSIWPCIFVHAAWDFALILRSGEIGESSGTAWGQALASMLLFTPLALYGLFLSRPSKVQGPDGTIPVRGGPPAPTHAPPAVGEVAPNGLPAAVPPPPQPTDALGPWPMPPPEVEAVYGGRW